MIDTQRYELPQELKAHWAGPEEVRMMRALYLSGFASGARPENPIHELSPERLQDMLRRGSTKIFIVRKRTDTRRGDIVAMATLLANETLDGLKGFVHHVATSPGHRGRGLGLAVMKCLIDYADQAGVSEISLTCSPKRSYAWPLYRRLGFEEATPTNEPHAEGNTVLFRRRLPARAVQEPAKAIA